MLRTAVLAASRRAQGGADALATLAAVGSTGSPWGAAAAAAEPSQCSSCPSSCTCGSRGARWAHSSGHRLSGSQWEVLRNQVGLGRARATACPAATAPTAGRTRGTASPPAAAAAPPGWQRCCSALPSPCAHSGQGKGQLTRTCPPATRPPPSALCPPAPPTRTRTHTPLQGFAVNPCNSRLHPSFTEAGIGGWAPHGAGLGQARRHTSEALRAALGRLGSSPSLRLVLHAASAAACPRVNEMQGCAD